MATAPYFTIGATISTMSRWKQRGLALTLGLTLVVVPLGGFLAWTAAQLHGVESCSTCGVSRSVDRHFVFTHRSVPRPAGPAWADVALREPCTQHTWIRTGCWRIGSTFARYGAVVPD